MRSFTFLLFSLVSLVPFVCVAQSDARDAAVREEAMDRWREIDDRYSLALLDRVRAAKVKAGTFETTYRASKAIVGAVKAGVSYREYGPLVLQFLAEASIATDLATTDDERLLSSAYSDAAAAYAAAGRFWGADMESGAKEALLSRPWSIGRMIVERANESFLNSYRADRSPTPTPKRSSGKK